MSFLINRTMSRHVVLLLIIHAIIVTWDLKNSLFVFDFAAQVRNEQLFYNPCNTYKEVVAVGLAEDAQIVAASYDFDAAENYPHEDHDEDSCDPLDPVGLAVAAAGDDGIGAVGIAAAVGAALVAFVVAADQIDFERIVDEVAIAVVDHRLDAIHTRAYYQGFTTISIISKHL